MFCVACLQHEDIHTVSEELNLQEECTTYRRHKLIYMTAQTGNESLMINAKEKDMSISTYINCDIGDCWSNNEPFRRVNITFEYSHQILIKKPQKTETQSLNFSQTIMSFKRQTLRFVANNTRWYLMNTSLINSHNVAAKALASI